MCSSKVMPRPVSGYFQFIFAQNMKLNLKSKEEVSHVNSMQINCKVKVHAQCAYATLVLKKQIERLGILFSSIPFVQK